MGYGTRNGGRWSRAWGLGLLAGSLALAGCYRGGAQLRDDDEDDGGDDAAMDGADLVGPGVCVDTDRFFKEKIWAPVLSVKCIGCHNPTGAAKDTDLVMQMSDFPGYLEANQQTLENVARLEIDGIPLLLAKPSATVEHGGGLQLAADSEEYALLGEMIERFGAPTHCTDDGEIDRFFDGVEELDEEQTLRKAVFLLASRMPTAEELDAVRGEGIDALDAVLDEVLREEAFYSRSKEIFNDLLHTDAFRIGDDAVFTLDDETFPDPDWYDAIEDNDQRNLMRRRTNDAIAREPLEIIEHVLRNEMPFTEAFTADYTIITPYSARAYGLDLSMFADPDDENEKLAYTFEEFPSAGLLTTSVFLNRYPSSPTNRNRARSRYFYKFFLATDIMRLASRPLDATEIQSHNPTSNEGACTVCHDNLDPVAGAFQNWDDTGRYRPPPTGWYPEMHTPGFGDIEIPYDQKEQALRWLTTELVQQSKFSLAMVHIIYSGLTGQEPLSEPTELEDVDYLASIRAFEAQDYTFKKVAEAFANSDHDLRVIIKEIVKTPYFRATNTTEALDEQRAMELAQMGTARILPPEALHRRLLATVGIPWRKNGVDVLLSSDYYKFFYGGIDSVSVTERLTQMNGVMANIVDRMANEVACNATAWDFTRVPDERYLFPQVEITDVPGSAGADAAIEANIVYLYDHLLGEAVGPDDEQVQRAVGVFEAVWQDGQTGLMLPEMPYPTALPGPCRATEDPMTGEALPEGTQLTEDPDYTVRAWMAVMSYMLADYRYLYE